MSTRPPSGFLTTREFPGTRFSKALLKEVKKPVRKSIHSGQHPDESEPHCGRENYSEVLSDLNSGIESTVGGWKWIQSDSYW